MIEMLSKIALKKFDEYFFNQTSYDMNLYAYIREFHDIQNNKDDILCFEELYDKKTRKYDSKEIKINIYLSLKIKVIQNK